MFMIYFFSHETNPLYLPMLFTLLEYPTLDFSLQLGISCSVFASSFIWSDSFCEGRDPVA